MGVTARATKRQVKEVRAMLDGTDRNADEKLRLLNAKYLQQVGLPFSFFSASVFMFPPSIWSMPSAVGVVRGN